MIHPFIIRKAFVMLGIDEATFRIADAEDKSNDEYIYCSLDDNEFQLHRVGDMPVNYVTDETL